MIKPVLLNSTGDIAAQDGMPYGLYVALAQAMLDHEVIQLAVRFLDCLKRMR
jgi:hypothetical protein